MHLAKATVNRFGRDGEMSVRLGLRAYGQWRGREMREAHHALGHPVNMRTLVTCWDNASTYVDKESISAEGRFDDFDSEFNVRSCPAADAWKTSSSAKRSASSVSVMVGSPVYAAGATQGTPPAAARTAASAGGRRVAEHSLSRGPTQLDRGAVFVLAPLRPRSDSMTRRSRQWCVLQ